MATITFDNVVKRYDNGHVALAGLDLHVAEAEFLILVGPSGCGKSTALRIVAGLDSPSSGRLLIDGKPAQDAAPRDRDIAMVFQSYALYPHLSVEQNIGFGLRVRGMPAGECRAKVRDVAALLELTDYLARKPAQLSGGQRQRVAMARALVRSPNAFLMDEPLSNLDARLRGQMREEIATLQGRTGVTTIYVTHDQVEAMTMGSRVAVMDRGVLQQVGPPRELYDRPANRFVAGFLGSPAMNFYEARIDEQAGRPTSVRLGPHRIGLDTAMAIALERHDPARPLVVGLRPEAIRLASVATDGIPAAVRFVEDLGATLLASVDIEGVPPQQAPSEGDDDFATGRRHTKVLLDGRVRLSQGEVIGLMIDPSELHIFDAATGLAIRAEFATLSGPARARSLGG